MDQNDKEALVEIKVRQELLQSDFKDHKSDDRKNFSEINDNIKQLTLYQTKIRTTLWLVGVMITILVPIIVKFMS